LNKNRTIDDLSFPDQAVASPPGPLFANEYRSVPYAHFKAGIPFAMPQFTLHNMKNAPEPLKYIPEAYYINYHGNDSTVVHDPNLNPSNEQVPIDNSLGRVEAFETKAVTLSYLPDPADPNAFAPSSDGVKIELVINVDTGDNTTPDYLDFLPRYGGVEFRTNDTIRSTYMLKNYYAYDDGHAEYAAGLVQAGNLAAYEFELQAVSEDTLTGFDIYLPSYGVSSNQTVEFFVYGDQLLEPKLPGQSDHILLAIPPKTIQRKGIDEFQRITFLPAILIPSKKFFIGWREPASGDVLVGLDVNNDTGDKIWVNTNGSWFQNDRVKGSLMIRPIFGKGNIDPTTGVEEQLESRYAVYPNPSDGTFYIDGNPDKVEMMSVTGQRIEIQTEKVDDRLMASVNEPSGLYILRTFKGRSSFTQKIIIRR
jgi:hypothetical protein